MPAVVDLAAMREAMKQDGRRSARDQPAPAGRARHRPLGASRRVTAAQDALAKNAELEFEPQHRALSFLQVGPDRRFRNFKAVPPDTGIVHQVNLEYLARVVMRTPAKERRSLAYPDTLVGTDSHTTLINGLGVLGWGVGGIEAEAAMLGQPVSMLLPHVIGVRAHRRRCPRARRRRDLVLTVTQMLRKHGVVDKFVEFFGDGLAKLPLADRATIAEHGARVRRDLRHLPDRRRDAPLPRAYRPLGRAASRSSKAYAKQQGLWPDDNTPAGDLHAMSSSSISAPSSRRLAGPARPQDRVPLRAREATSFSTCSTRPWPTSARRRSRRPERR